MNLRLFALSFAFVLAACSPTDDESPDVAAVGYLSGTAFYYERVAMPEGSYLELELVDVSTDAEPVIARQTLSDVANPPYAFSLTYDPAGIDPADHHELWLTLYMPDGTAFFSAEVVVDLSTSTVDQVRLIGVEPRDEHEAEPGQAWQCGDILLEADYADDFVRLTLPWKDVTLEQTASTTGLHYSDGETGFWSKSEDESMLNLPGREPVTCQPGTRRSQWALARQAGVSFRATGNEPGWTIEVTEGSQPTMHLVLDYGVHELTFENVTVQPQRAGYVADSPGNHAEVELVYETCRDTMVGWAFPVRVEMRLNETDLVACGRFL